MGGVRLIEGCRNKIQGCTVSPYIGVAGLHNYLQ